MERLDIIITIGHLINYPKKNIKKKEVMRKVFLSLIGILVCSMFLLGCVNVSKKDSKQKESCLIL